MEKNGLVEELFVQGHAKVASDAAPASSAPAGWLHSSRKEAARQDVDRRIVPAVLDAVFQEVQFAPNAGEPDLYPKREAGAACPERIGAKPRGRL